MSLLLMIWWKTCISECWHFCDHFYIQMFSCCWWSSDFSVAWIFFAVYIQCKVHKRLTLQICKEHTDRKMYQIKCRLLTYFPSQSYMNVFCDSHAQKTVTSLLFFVNCKFIIMFYLMSKIAALFKWSLLFAMENFRM